MGQYRNRGTPMGSMASGLEEDAISTASSSQARIRGVSPGQPGQTRPRISTAAGVSNTPTLYLLGERSMMKNLAKHSNLRSVEFVPVDFVSQSAIADSFKILFKACLPHDSGKSSGSGGSSGVQNSPPDLDPVAVIAGGGGGAGGAGGVGTGASCTASGTATSANLTGQTGTGSNSTNIHTAINESGWLIQLQSLLQLAGAVVYLLDTQGSSVALCLEDGTDAVTQTVALAQIMLDPHYRTLAGFWALIEKEWLLFGHRFNQRLNQTATSKGDPISPVFLQFLDAVHQLLRQFPLSFEFNDFFLQFLAYHHMSNRFHNFKYDSESDRVSAWLNANDGLNSNLSVSMDITTGLGAGHLEQDKLLRQYDQHSIWTYIQKQHEEWPVFFNFRYSRQMSEKILRPATNLASLDIWQFYLSEDLATGPTYDLDHFSPSYRKQHSRPYEPILRQGFNNTHVEQIYAVLGLREGEEAIGWRKAWEQAQDEINFYPQIRPVRRRIQHRVIDTTTSAHHSQSSSKASGLHDPSSTNRLTITMDFREGSEPATSLTTVNTDTLFAVPPRRAVSGTVTDMHRSANHTTTLTPQRAAGSKPFDVATGTTSDPSFMVGEPDAGSQSKPTNDLNKVVNGIVGPSEKVVRVTRVTHGTHSLTSESEDEAFHDDGLEEVYTEPDDLGSDIDSLDDCMAARSAAMDDHRAATLRRLTRRHPRLSQNADLHSQPSLETGLGYESDSLTSGSVYSTNQTKSVLLSTIATAEEIATSTLMFSTPHKFAQTTISMSNVRCQYCQNFLLSFSTTRAAARCTQCNYLCHEKCAPLVPKYCRPGGRQTPLASDPIDPASFHASVRQHSMLGGLREEDQSADRSRLAGFLSPKPPWRTSHEGSRNSEPLSRSSAVLVQDRRVKTGERSPQIRSQFSVERLDGNVRRFSETAAPSVPVLPSHLASASFYGLLYKMNHRKLLQHWKQRFFVLDTTRHQLRYYDTTADEMPRGCVDLQDVRAVRLVKNVVPHQKRVTDCGVFELETSTRTYRFAAEPAEKAAEWVERIQNTIQ
ncbi:unnamed protein product [Echinostoma caproni]|uniref:Myotubularin phosphatase domain-containing protein n=1 Tax=Echinostoma caproni TaxID=27848 RepID=A0A183AKY4_9TREM|nr:unnamed protein product [Echinostoma caproni]